MTTFYQQLNTEITTGPLSSELAPLVTANNYAGIAAVLNRQDISHQYSRLASARTVMAELGPAAGAAILDKLQAVADAQGGPTKWVMSFLKIEGGIDVGSDATRGAIDGLVTGGALTVAEGASLKGLAERLTSRAAIAFPSNFPVATDDVARALKGGWRVQFTPFKGKRTVGTAIAVFSDGSPGLPVASFRYTETVNLDLPASAQGFAARAKAAKAAADSAVAVNVEPLNNLLNT